VERIFSKMMASYGSLFADRWRDCDIAEVKDVWAEELASFSDNPACFGLALKAMVEECKFPPTLPEFVALCRKCYTRPVLDVPLLEKPKPASEADARERINELAKKFGRVANGYVA
jgi:hypothetical protein